MSSSANPSRDGVAALRRRPPWMEDPSAAVQLLKIVILAVIVVVMVYPFLYVVATSFSSATAQSTGLQLLPTGYSLDAYKSILSGGIVTRALLVSVGITVVGTFLSVAFTVMLAWGLSRTRDVPGSKFALYLVIFTMLFSAGIIPNFLLMKYLGMLDTYWSLIIPGMISAFNLVVIRNFFMDLPAELLDSARMDGCSEWAILTQIALPLSKGVVAVVALFYGVSYWNDFFNAMLYINDTSKWPIPLVLNQYVLQGSALDQLVNPNQPPPPAQTVQMAVVVLATTPILLVYPFAQRYFTKGVLTGAIKG